MGQQQLRQKKLGRKFIGIVINSEYIVIAQKRLENTEIQKKKDHNMEKQNNLLNLNQMKNKNTAYDTIQIIKKLWNY